MKNKFKIGEVAKFKKIDAQTLRYYDRLGLLRPDITDETNGYRYYSIPQFVEIDRIKFLKQLGMSLEEIKSFQETDQLDDLLMVLRDKQEAFKEQLTQLQILYNNINRAVDAIDTARSYEIERLKIEYRDDFFGVRGDSSQITNIIEFEKDLFNLSSKYPEYARVGNNFALVSVLSNQLFDNKDLVDERQLLLRIDGHYKDQKDVEHVPIGKCVVTYIKSPKILFEGYASVIKTFMTRNKLKPRENIYVSPVINRFITSKVDDYLYEVLIPVKE